MLRIKLFIKRFLPFALPFALIPEYFLDYFRYLRYSGIFGSKYDKHKLIGRIIAQYHSVEKGLVMPEPRLGFGMQNLLNLISNINIYIKRFGTNNEQLLVAIKVILEYYDFNTKNNYTFEQDIEDKILNIRKIIGIVDGCKQIEADADNYFKYSNSDFLNFSNSRHSVRNYANKFIPISQIEEAVDIARNTPSSCNRQSVRAYVYQDRDTIKKILDLQGGNRGWGHLTDKLIVIASDLSASHGVFERNRVYVDGGMFAMNLLYALHFKKIAACSLNCSFSVKVDKRMRKVTGIKKSEVFIVIISCGYVPQSFQVTSSFRSPVSEFLSIDNLR